jgi:hypothetical protein
MEEASKSGFAGSGGAGIFDTLLHGRLPATIAVISITLIALGIAKLSSPTLDPKEPPLLKSRIPVIGHIIGRFRDSYGMVVRPNTRRFRSRPAPGQLP